MYSSRANVICIRYSLTFRFSFALCLFFLCVRKSIFQRANPESNMEMETRNMGRISPLKPCIILKRMSAVVFIRACEHLSFVLFAFACVSDQSYVLTDVCVIIAWHTNGFVFIPLGAYLNVNAENCFMTVEALYKIHIGPRMRSIRFATKNIYLLTLRGILHASQPISSLPSPPLNEYPTI